jgi:hypothetical protein
MRLLLALALLLLPALAASSQTRPSLPHTGTVQLNEVTGSIALPAAGGLSQTASHFDAASSARRGVWLPYWKADSTLLHTYGTSVAVDPAGGIHAVYSIYFGSDGGQNPATYAYCADGCTEPQNWSFVRLGTQISDARIQLDPGGRPRVMLFGHAGIQGDPYYDWRYRYQFASCDWNCTSPGAWSITTLAEPVEPAATREHDNNRYFVLDRSGNPLLVYKESDADGHQGTFALTCTDDCSNADRWIETRIDEALYWRPSISLSATGQVRMSFDARDEEGDLFIWYDECNAACTTPANWGYVRLIPVHGSAKHSLSVNSAGRPRMVVYSGNYTAEPFEPERLYYLWCEEACAQPNSEWYFYRIPVPWPAGDGATIHIDEADRPRIAYEDGGNVGYAWCTEHCESGNALWRVTRLESSSDLLGDNEMLPIRRCSVSTWFLGVRPSIAFDSAGNPRIGFDAQHYWYGVEIVSGVPYACNYKDVNVSRVVLANHPDTGVAVEPPGNLLSPIALSPAYPNPFDVEARFTLSVDREQWVTVDLYDVLGRRAARLFQGRMVPGQLQPCSIDGSRLPGGSYVIRVVGEAFNTSHLVLVAR